MESQKRIFLKKYDRPYQRRFWIPVLKIEQWGKSGDLENDFRKFYEEYCQFNTNDISIFRWNETEKKEAIKLAKDVFFEKSVDVKNKGKCKKCKKIVNIKEEFKILSDKGRKIGSMMEGYFQQIVISERADVGDYICENCWE